MDIYLHFRPSLSPIASVLLRSKKSFCNMGKEWYKTVRLLNYFEHKTAHNSNYVITTSTSHYHKKKNFIINYLKSRSTLSSRRNRSEDVKKGRERGRSGSSYLLRSCHLTSGRKHFQRRFNSDLWSKPRYITLAEYSKL